MLRHCQLDAQDNCIQWDTFSFQDAHIATLVLRPHFCNIDIHYCHLHRPLKARLLQLPLSQPRLHPNTATTAHPKLTRTRCHQNVPAYHHITHVLKSLHWLKIPERIHFKVLFLTYYSLQSSQPRYLRELFIIQPTRSATVDHHPVSLFFDIRSLLISCSPTEPNPSLHHVFGMTYMYHLNSAPFLYLHHRHCKSQDIIFIRLLYPSSPGFSTQN